MIPRKMKTQRNKDIIMSNAQELTRKKLTKKFFMELHEGSFLVSNVGYAIDKPVFAEKISPSSKRLAQWEKIVSVGADQRLCKIYKTKMDHEAWLKEFIAKH